MSDMKCPKCGYDGGWFSIEATSVFQVAPDGTDDYGDVEWNDNSSCQCSECYHEGTVIEFTPVLPRVKEKLIELAGYVDSADIQLIDAIRGIADHCEYKTENQVFDELLKLGHEIVDAESFDELTVLDLFMCAHWLTRCQYHEIILCYDDRSWDNVYVRAPSAEQARLVAYDENSAPYAFHVQEIPETELSDYAIDIGEQPFDWKEDQTQRAFEEAGKLADSAVADAHQEDD
jgi:hypothetical protein